MCIYAYMRGFIEANMFTHFTNSFINNIQRGQKVCNTTLKEITLISFRLKVILKIYSIYYISYLIYLYWFDLCIFYAKINSNIKKTNLKNF